MRHADAVMSDTLTIDAACMRRVHGEVGGGKLNTGEASSRRRRRVQQLSPRSLASFRKKLASPGLDDLVAKNRSVSMERHAKNTL